jgi:hypothetical protein
MSHFHKGNDELFVADGVKDAAKTLANAILVVAGELFTPWRAWIKYQALDPDDDLKSFFIREGLDFLGR